VVLFSALAWADSHPSWWTLASPEATALVGIQWEYVRASPFGGAVQAELWGAGGLGFPDVACLQDARQILISSPALLAIEAGDFPAATLRHQASAKGMKPANYHNVALWIAPANSTLSIAWMDESIVMIGERKALEAAIDRSMEAGRNYSPLLSRAARFSPEDLWVVATRLPDPLASLFVPLDTEARGFDGGISLRDGLRLDASLDAGSEEAAAFAADTITQSIPTLVSLAQNLKVTAEADHVILTLDVTPAEFAASLRTTRTASPAPVATPQPELPPVLTPGASAVQPIQAPPPAPEPEKPVGPQIVHIYGLDDGPREILLPPVKRPEHK
jgi:hypothetical protein